MAWDAGPLLITNTPELVWYLNIQQKPLIVNYSRRLNIEEALFQTILNMVTLRFTH